MAFRRILLVSLVRPVCFGFPSKVSTNKVSQLFTLKKHLLENNSIATIVTKTKQETECVDLAKEKIISKLNFENIEHALPFYKLPINTLLHIYKVTKYDEKHGYCKNRLYYIASRLKCPPWLLSKRIAERTFVYGLSFDWLESSLNVLLEMGVTSDRILRDLWVLKYKSDTIQERLQKVKNMGVEKMYPWMVRCSEDILNRYISILKETKDILGDTKSTQIYLANRLNTSVEAVNDMCKRTPALRTIRVTKVKNFLDLLLTEGFTVEDIANKPRIFSASQKTVKQRLDKLRQLGIKEINLNVLCRTKKNFQKFCESIEVASSERSDIDTSI